jgi:hypothetical protein
MGHVYKLPGITRKGVECRNVIPGDEIACFGCSYTIIGVKEC